MGSVTGLTAAGLTGLHAAAERHVGEEKVPGLVALVASGGQVHVEALGRLAVGGPAVARDSIFRIASTTKPITAAATLALAAEGLLGLDEPVDRLLPELAGRRVLRRADGPLDDTVPAAFCPGSSTAARGGFARRSTTAARSAGTADWARPGWLTRPGT